MPQGRISVLDGRDVQQFDTKTRYVRRSFQEQHCFSCSKLFIRALISSAMHDFKFFCNNLFIRKQFSSFKHSFMSFAITRSFENGPPRSPHFV